VKAQYLIDHWYLHDEATGFATMGHLLAFNPGSNDVELTITLYYEEREPETFSLAAPAGKSTESNYAGWPIRPNTRFAMMVESSEPVILQATVGWNNAGNDYSTAARVGEGDRVRECVTSYMAIGTLATDWYLPDGIVIDRPQTLWIRESEWAILLNPGDAPARVTMALHYDALVTHTVEVPPRRLLCTHMDEIARRNVHYGVHFSSDQPIAAQWLRTVNWNDYPELMSFWSVPCVPGPIV
jgi:hypothetical protein